MKFKSLSIQRLCLGDIFWSGQGLLRKSPQGEEEGGHLIVCISQCEVNEKVAFALNGHKLACILLGAIMECIVSPDVFQ